MEHKIVLLFTVLFLFLLTCLDGAPTQVNQTARHRRQINVIQRRLIQMFDPKPIVDTMREEDKYGNEVDHPIGKAVVRTVERFSNAINSVWNIPVETAKQMSRGATEALNNLGARIVGLEK